jgi:hypothetical protein
VRVVLIRRSASAVVADADAFKRSGQRPDGTAADRAMPRNTHMNDTDLEALFLYLKSSAAAGTVQ